LDISVPCDTKAASFTSDLLVSLDTTGEEIKASFISDLLVSLDTALVEKEDAGIIGEIIILLYRFFMVFMFNINFFFFNSILRFYRFTSV
jgi:hypothetical protein